MSRQVLTHSLRLAVLSLVLGSAGDAAAYTWMIRHRYAACATCHVDPSGGETLTAYGRAQGELLLRSNYGASSAPAEPEGSGAGGFESFDSFDSFDGDAAAGSAPSAESPGTPEATATSDDAGSTEAAPRRGQFLWAIETPDWLSLGGSLRVASLIRPLPGSSSVRVFPMQADVYGAIEAGVFRAGGSLGLSRVPASSPHARPAQLTTGQDDGINLLSRSHWLGIAPDDAWLIRAGRLNLPFGLRVPEHVLWVRSETQTDRDADQQHGVAVAYTGEGVRGELMAIAGNYQLNPDRYRERGYSGFAELMWSDTGTIGLSSMATVAQSDLVQDIDGTTLRQAHGVFARWAPVSSLAVLGEADLLLRTERDPGYVGLLQLDWEIASGLHVLGTTQLLDAGYRADPAWFDRRRRPGNGLPRFGSWAGLQWFFYSHLDLRVDVRYEQPPTHEQRNGAFDIFAQLHAFL